MQRIMRPAGHHGPAVVSRSNFIARLMLVCLLALVLSSLLVRFSLALNSSSISDAIHGDDLAYQTNPLTWIREISYFIIFLFSCFLLLNRKKGILVLLFAFGLVAICLLKMIAEGESLVKIPYGIRVFIIILTYPAIVYLARNGSADRLIKLLKLYMILIGPVAVYQALTFPEFWGRTAFGTRANGTYTNPIIFSMVVGSFACLFLVAGGKNCRKWILYCLVIALLTGGRSGMLACLLALISSFSPRQFKNKYMISGLFLVLVPVMFWLVSAQAVSGRELAQQSGLEDARFGVWGAYIQQFQSLSDIVFGIGIGEGTNAGLSYADQSQGSFTDNTFLMLMSSFGLPGAIAFFAWIVLLARRVEFRGYVVLAVFMLYFISQSMPEMHPAYVIMTLAIALSIEKSKTIPERQPAVPAVAGRIESNRLNRPPFRIR